MAIPIPSTDWFLVAKLDRAELYGEIAGDAAWIALTGLLSAFVIGVGTFLLRQRERLKLAKAVRESQAERLRALGLLDSIADGSDDAIFAKDLEGRYILCNRATSKFIGKSVEKVLGRDDQAIFPVEQAEILMAADRHAITENHVRSREETLDTPYGQRIFLSTRGPLRGDAGKIIGTFGVSRDITEHKRAEKALRKQAEELYQRNEELERFNRVAVKREIDIIALKQQINDLSRELGREPPHALGFLNAPGPDKPANGE
jgi:PAS domain S-box-containing protein